MQGLSGRLRKVVVYKNQTTGVSSEKSARYIYVMEDNLLHASYAMGSSMLLLSSSYMSYVVCLHSAHSVRRDQRMCQVVAYKSLKTIENR